MREFINKHGIVIASVAIVLAGLLYWLIRPAGVPTSNSKYTWFVDEDTGKETTQLATEVPPLANDKGDLKLVEEVKISCDDGRTSHPVYWIKYAPDQQKRLQELAQLPQAANENEFRQRDQEKLQLIDKGQWICLPAPNSPWVLAHSADGQQILSDAAHCPKTDQTPMRVYPQR